MILPMLRVMEGKRSITTSKSAWLRMNISEGSVVITEAERGSPVSRAISPK